MIDRTEIIRLAGELGLQPRMVEKDYVLGWVLAGIARDAELSVTWLFKGGTCLKKCFFETYRFSEDLDFTVTEPAQLDRDFLIARFKLLGAWLYDATGIELPKSLMRMLGPRGNPQARNLFNVIGYLQRQAGVELHVTKGPH